MSDLDLVAVDPRRAYAEAEAMLPGRDTAERVRALRLLALACKELGRLAEGLDHLQDALRDAEAHGLAYAAAQVRMNMVGLLTARGDVAGALAAADVAEPVLTGVDADRLLANRACALARSGRVAEVARLARRDIADPTARVGLLMNTGMAKICAGKLTRGEADLRTALSVADRAGLRHQAVMVRCNLAVLAYRRGDLPAALALYDRVEPELAGVGERLCQLRLDRAETLIAARLAGEAREQLRAAIDRLTTGAYACDLADALLLLAHAELADDAPAAAVTAERARLAFGERTGSALLAHHVGLRARWASGERTAALTDEAEQTARRLAEAGWAAAAADTRTLACLSALAQDDTARAERLLPSPTGPMSVRVAAWHATALLRLTRGERTGAAAAVRAGLRVVDDHAAALGAAELRGHAAGWGAELAALGIRLARTPQALLTASERARAITNRPPARPPQDRKLAALLAELRRVTAEPGTAEAQQHLEAAIRTQTRTARVAAAARPDRSHGRLVDRLVAELGDRAFVETVRDGDELRTVAVADGRCRNGSAGSYEEVRRDVRLARFAVTRLARGDESAQAGLACAAGRLRKRLLGGLAERPLVIAPTGALHGMPWAALSEWPVTVVPSALSWLRARQVARPNGPVVLAAGPGLDHAAAELAAVRGHHPRATVLTGATVEEVRRRLDGAAVAHLAAHGTFRDGNALFSSVRLADGPLMAYDLEGLARPPWLIVLSACDAGRSEVRPGEAVMGLVSAALAYGTGTVVAGVTPVGDAAARSLMAGFHRHLAAGRSPAQALAAAPRTPGALGFVCFGAG